MAELGGQQPVKYFAVKARAGEVLLKIVGDEDLLAPGITGAELAPRERGVAQVPTLQCDGFEDGVGRNFPRDGNFAMDDLLKNGPSACGIHQQQTGWPFGFN